MTQYISGFEGHADEEVISPANSASSGVQWTAVAGVCVADTARSAHGSRSMRCDSVSGSNDYVRKTMDTASLTVGMRAYYYLTAAATTDTTLMWVGIGATRVASLRLTAASQLRAMDSTSPTGGNWTAASAFPLNQWVRIEMWVAVDSTTAANGDWSGAYYLGDSTTPVGSFSVTNANLGTAALTDYRFGKAVVAAYATPFWIDDTLVNDAAAGLPGPYAVAAAANVRPSGVASNAGGWTVTGAADAAAALSDESDSSYVACSTAAGATVYNFPPISAGEKTVKLRLATASGAGSARVRMLVGGSYVGPGQLFDDLTTTWQSKVWSLTGAEATAAAGSTFQVEVTANAT